MSGGAATSLGNRTCFPTGSVSGKYLRAIVWLMMARRSPRATSTRSKIRPRSSRRQRGHAYGDGGHIGRARELLLDAVKECCARLPCGVVVGRERSSQDHGVVRIVAKLGVQE